MAPPRAIGQSLARAGLASRRSA